jgi:hypothetical protein
VHRIYQASKALEIHLVKPSGTNVYLDTYGVMYPQVSYHVDNSAAIIGLLRIPNPNLPEDFPAKGWGIMLRAQNEYGHWCRAHFQCDNIREVLDNTVINYREFRFVCSSGPTWKVEKPFVPPAGERPDMSRQQLVDLECRNTLCLYHSNGGCATIPKITLNHRGKPKGALGWACWTQKEKVDG